jgi:chemotaxis protein methyltransferase CheR
VKDKDDFGFLAELLRRRSGLMLGNQRPRFAETRLAPVVRRFGFKSTHELVNDLRHGHETLAEAVVEAMTVNDSAFFRDRKMFDEFRDGMLPGLLARRADKKRLRIWCAACASGQEPYSVAMLLEDAALRSLGWKIDLIATDISTDSVARAENGYYSPFEVQRGLSDWRLNEYFTKEGDGWRIKDSIRRMVVFRQFNILDSLGWLWEMDVVFCRNVLMYFDHKMRASVLEQISDIMAPDGTLVTGSAETIVPPASFYSRPERIPGLYSKLREAPARRRTAS